jgi:hypothetical protein
MRKIVVLVSLAAAALSVWFANSESGNDSPSPVPAESVAQVMPSATRSIDTPEDGQTDLTSDVSTATSNPRTEPARTAAGPGAPVATTARALQMWEQRKGRVPPLFRQREDAFLAEPFDPLWSRTREAEILSEIAQMTGLRLINVEVECRASMCRLQLTQNVPVPAGGEQRGVPDPVYTELFARLRYEQMMIPIGMTGDNAGTATSLTYLPRQ